MNRNKITIAVQATTAAMVLGLASQASAIELNPGSIDAELYGYARMNAVYDIDEDIGISTQAGSFDKVNTGAAEDNEVTGHFDADAVQSRLGVKVTTEQGVKVVVEGDFRGNGGGDLRLRHAYGEYMGVLLGQTWSNFNSFVGNTSVLDFDALAGNAGLQGRVTQARYTTGPLSVSLEDNVTSVLNEPADSEKNSLPTLTARFENSSGPLSLSAAALMHQVEYDTGTQDDQAIGYAVFGAAKFAVTDTVSIQGAVTYSDGANSYLYRSGDNFGAADAYVKGNGDLDTITGYGGTIGVGVDVGPGSINAGYGWVTNDWDDAEDDGVDVADEHETNSNAMLNYMWSPVKNVTMGVEYAYFMVDKQNGDDGDASRIMFAGQYNF
ncbi:DcaP family trimeric outer membrane transporter [Marinobacter mangrovi]|uniref:DcaP family trimeric outer membrane transporter n=1 Tax=Marinobacter mangrovi TaxID=2803918 RepID=UPI0019344D3F|nr:DcaP family trimeric outer membrane transporter [Marinobacter mangrovi]